jgi:hypothetical protein
MASGHGESRNWRMAMFPATKPIPTDRTLGNLVFIDEFAMRVARPNYRKPGGRVAVVMGRRYSPAALCNNSLILQA